MKGRDYMVGGIAVLVGAGAAVLAMGGTAPAVGTTDRAAIETIVREYILTHPEILPEAMRNLEEREVSKVVSQNRSALEKPFAGAWEGAADGDVTLVEFFDYNCSYCRASLPTITRLLSEDKKLKIVYRELPILGEASESAARHSLAVAQLGNYATFHRLLFGAGRTSQAVIDDALSKTGIDKARVKAALTSSAVENEIAQNLSLQRSLNLSGTPSWVVGNRVFAGAVGYDELKKAIAEARAK
jgi:protein-disulfide isomerase